MSLKVKLQQDKIRTFLKNITVDVIVSVVKGTMDDVLAGNHGDDEPLVPGYTAGDLRANPDLRYNSQFIECAVGAGVGRMVRMWCMHNDVDLMLALPMLRITETVERKAIAQLSIKTTLH